MTSKPLPLLREIYFARLFLGVEEYFSRIPGVYDSISVMRTATFQIPPMKRSVPARPVLLRPSGLSS